MVCESDARWTGVRVLEMRVGVAETEGERYGLCWRRLRTWLPDPDMEADRSSVSR